MLGDAGPTFQGLLLSVVLICFGDLRSRVVSSTAGWPSERGSVLRTRNVDSMGLRVWGFGFRDVTFIWGFSTHRGPKFKPNIVSSLS